MKPKWILFTMNFPVCLDIAHYEDKSKQKILYNQEKREKKF